MPNFWADPKSGIGYQVQVEVPRPVVRSPKGIEPIASIGDLKMVPVKQTAAGQVLVRDVATVTTGTMPGEIDRYNMKRQVSMTANFAGTDLGSVSRQVTAALRRAGEPPGGVTVEVRGQIPPLGEMLRGLAIGLGLAIVVIFLLLSANFQSWQLSLITVSTAPAVIAGVVLMLCLTGTTLNIQSFIGAIMAVGVAMANAILLVTFAEGRRRAAAADIGLGKAATAAAVEGAGRRLRPILMTSCAMMAGMLPMALAWGESGQQNAPLGRAVIGGLAAATLATLFVLPSVFALVQSHATTESASLDPDDPESAHFCTCRARAIGFMTLLQPAAKSAGNAPGLPGDGYVPSLQPAAKNAENAPGLSGGWLRSLLTSSSDERKNPPGKPGALKRGAVRVATSVKIPRASRGH